MEPYTLLVISRTQSLAGRLRRTPTAERCVIRWASSTARALQLDVSPSLLILDLPPSGGQRSAARLKERFHCPLLVLTRPEQEPPAPADVALSRNCSAAALAERIEAILVDHAPRRIRAGKMTLDLETRRLQINGQVYQLRPLGSRVLAQLMAHAGQVVPRDELFHRVWRTDDGDNTRALDVHIAYLRRTLEADPHRPTLIRTERGVGYRLVPPPAE